MQLQQDAAQAISSVFNNSKIYKEKIEYKKFEDLKKIREIRNSLAGHSIRQKDGNKSYSYRIIRSMLTADTITYRRLSDQGEESDYKKISINEIIEQQKNGMVGFFSKIIEQLVESDNKHREKFRDTKLVAIIKKFEYPCKKMMETSTVFNSKDDL